MRRCLIKDSKADCPSRFDSLSENLKEMLARIPFLAAGSFVIFGVLLAARSCREAANDSDGRHQSLQGYQPGRPEALESQSTSPSKRLRESESDSMRRVREKLEAVILPNVDFENANAEEAVEFLQYRLSQIDDPSLRGVLIVIDAPIPFREPEPRTQENAPFSMEATNISVWNVLKRVASDCKMKIQPMGEGIELIPLGPEPDEGK
jgi:hypothetical protein